LRRKPAKITNPLGVNVAGRDLNEIVIDPRTSNGIADLREILSFRGLLYFLVLRDIKVRYKQSLLGIAWVVLKPLAAIAIFTIIFGKVARFPSDGAPYPIFVLIGLIPWNFFSSVMTNSTNSIVNGSNLVSKVYFPRILVPVGASLSLMVDVLVSFALLLFMMAFYGMAPGAAIAWAPLLLIFAVITALGPGLLFSALYVKYRDVGHIIPFLLQIWLYATPVVYPADFIPAKYNWLLYVNPMAGVVEAFRACIIPDKPFNLMLIAASVFTSIFMFAIGFYYFRRVEKTFADII
jgi:lipopolysaccharide transport system permease protein